MARPGVCGLPAPVRPGILPCHFQCSGRGTRVDTSLSRGTLLHPLLDDFLILGAPGSNECAEALRITRETCTELGVPLAPDKVEGPTTQITFLSIGLNTTKLTVGLSVQKMAELQRLLTQWSKLTLYPSARTKNGTNFWNFHSSNRLSEYAVLGIKRELRNRRI